MNSTILILLLLFHFIMALFNVAFYTLGERKLMASVQRRIGPNVHGFYGLLQPFADGLKLLTKEIVIPYRSSRFMFLVAPMFFFIASFVLWIFIPFGISYVLFDGTYSLLFFFTISSLAVYGIIFSGWSSNSRYALLGSLRSAAQMISYEISLSFVYIALILVTSTSNIYEMVFYQYYGPMLVWSLLPLFIVFLVSVLAETNRAPFDLPESESELVAGYNIEYSSIVFAMFFLAEYSNMIIMSFIIVLFFFGDFMFVCFSVFLLVVKVLVVMLWFVCVRAVLPRYRYDHLMYIGWRSFLPLTFGFVVFLASFLYFFGGILLFLV